MSAGHRHILDTWYLERISSAPPPELQTWKAALQHSGLLPLFQQGAAVSDPELRAGIERVRRAWELLERVNAAPPAPPSRALRSAALALAAAFAVLAVIVQSGSWAGAAIVALVFAGIAHFAARGGEDLHGKAQSELVRAIQSLSARSWVSPMGEGHIEAIPVLGQLDDQLRSLEEALERAGATHQKIDELVLRISSTNEKLGREAEDEEVRHLRVQQNRLRAELMRVAEQIEDFRARRAQVRSDVERLRVIAQRKALSREVEALAGAAEGSGMEAARAEVDLVEFDSRARLLSKEVAAADNALSVAIELVSLRSP